MKTLTHSKQEILVYFENFDCVSLKTVRLFMMDLDWISLVRSLLYSPNSKTLGIILKTCMVEKLGNSLFFFFINYSYKKKSFDVIYVKVPWVENCDFKLMTAFEDLFNWLEIFIIACVMIFWIWKSIFIFWDDQVWNSNYNFQK